MWPQHREHNMLEQRNLDIFRCHGDENALKLLMPWLKSKKAPRAENGRLELPSQTHLAGIVFSNPNTESPDWRGCIKRCCLCTCVYSLLMIFISVCLTQKCSCAQIGHRNIEREVRSRAPDYKYTRQKDFLPEKCLYQLNFSRFVMNL